MNLLNKRRFSEWRDEKMTEYIKRNLLSTYKQNRYNREKQLQTQTMCLQLKYTRESCRVAIRSLLSVSSRVMLICSRAELPPTHRK